jgi:hypothetical protein
MATRSIGRRADERRMARRAKFHANVQFRYKGTVGYATINDISCGGIRIDGSNVALPTKGEPVTIFLPVPQNLSRKRRLFMVDARVAWRDGHQGGVEFVDLPGEAEFLLEQYVDVTA